MIINKINVVRLFVALAVVFGLMATQVSVAKAQAESDPTFFCPIDLGVAANFYSYEPLKVEGDRIESVFSVKNNSSYALGGVRIGVGIYIAGAVNPSYWMILPDTYTLNSGEGFEAQLDLDVSNLPAGEYLMDIAAVQGDEVSLLGTLVMGTGNFQKKVINKTAASKKTAVVEVEVNGTKYEGQTIMIAEGESIVANITTTNKAARPLVDTAMVAIVTQGIVPLGTAVRSVKFDSVKLIPEGTRKTKLQDNFVEGGVYRVFAALKTENVLQPVVTVPLVIKDTVGNDRWAYVSKIGLSDYPLKVDSSVVACVNNFGTPQVEQTSNFLDLLGLNIALSSGEEKIAETRLTSDQVLTRGFFQFKPAKALSEFVLEVDLLNERFIAGTSSPESLSVVDSFSMKFSCEDSLVCDPEEEVVLSAAADQPVSKSPFFYLGIMLAATLLMYLMLRRLPPEKDDSNKYSDPNELK